MKRLFIIGVLIMTMIFTYSLAFAENGRSEKGFTDISKHWASEAINKVVDKESFPADGGKFLPGKAITRSEFVMMLHKALGIQIMYFRAPDITEVFEDVKNEDAYAAALNDLVTANIIDYKGKFRPNEVLPRDEMVHYIINSLEYMTGGNYALIKMMPAPFEDDKEINSLYKYDFVKAQLLKLVNGKGNNKFYPKDATTRAEAAVVIYRLTKTLNQLLEDVQVNPSVEVGKDGMKLKLMIVNNSDKTVVINHTSGQKYDFKLLDENKEILYTWSADKMFMAALGETSLEPGKSVEFSADIDGDLFNSVKEKAVYMKAYIVGSSDGFDIVEDGYEAEIKW